MQLLRLMSWQTCVDGLTMNDTLGNLSGRFSYEFVCDINKRVKRIYI